MIKQKLKKCAQCGEEKHIWKQIEGKKYCKECSFIVKEKGSPKVFSSIKPKMPKPSGEYALFLRLYAERKGICAVTNKPIPFDVSSFMHVLSKKAFPSYRLNAENILLVNKLVHSYYDNSDRETLLKHFPNAGFIYELKESLISLYYKEHNSASMKLK